MSQVTFHTEKRKVSELIPAVYNPRKLTDEQYKQLKKSLTKFDLAEIPVINTDNTILAGHMRLKILAELRGGDYEIDVRVPSRKLTEDECKEYNLRSNKNVGDWDTEALANYFDLSMLADVGFTEQDLGFDTLVDVEEDGFDAQKEYDSITDAKTRVGDMYQLGRHRIVCGDSTDREVVQKLMGDERADMVFTDPPYNVNYNYAKYEDGRKMKWAKIFNDNKTSEQYYQFLFDVLTNIYDFSKDTMALYLCHATKTQWENWAAFKDSGFHFSQTIIWLKERFILAMGQDYHRIYEPILFGWKEGKVHYKNKKLTKFSEFLNLNKTDFEEELDIWYLNRDKAKDYEHPTQKPVRLPERAIKKNCPIDGLLFEPFGSSGSTMMACEQLKRKCYQVELDPKYVDVIVGRYLRFTKGKTVFKNGKEIAW